VLLHAHPQLCGCEFADGLLLGLHDVGQRGIPAGQGAGVLITRMCVCGVGGWVGWGGSVHIQCKQRT
jgi:hypothetical protein